MHGGDALFWKSCRGTIVPNTLLSYRGGGSSTDDYQLPFFVLLFIFVYRGYISFDVRVPLDQVEEEWVRTPRREGLQTNVLLREISIAVRIKPFILFSRRQ